MKTERAGVGLLDSAPIQPTAIKVLFLNDHLGFEDGAIHGPARYFANVLGHFAPSAVTAKLCILRSWHPFSDQLRSKGIETIFLSRRKWDPRALTDLVRLIRAENVDLLHVAGMKGTMLGRIASKITGIPVILHFRDMNPEGALVRFIQRRLSRWTDAALAVSNPIREFAINEYAMPDGRIEVLHNPVSADISPPGAERRDEIRKTLMFSPATRVIAIIGRISPETGHLLLIRALPSLIAKLPDIRLMIVGDGPLREDCKSLVTELELEKFVHFTGHQNDIATILASVDVVTMPSAREGFPNTALESIAAGKPVVGFRVGGLPEIVTDNETGALVPPGDTVALMKALFQILTNDELRQQMKNSCLRHAKRFTVEEHVDKLEHIYGKLLSHTGESVEKPAY
jgi:glycosyltransferase involved in cell wall biosynthesis